MMARMCLPCPVSSERSFSGSPSTTIRSPWAPGATVPHPRSYGTFPRKIGFYAIEEKIVPVEAAIRSSTGLPADILKLKDRGYLRVGYFADVVVFGSTCKVYQNPTNASLGKRVTPGIIVGKNEETKGFKVLIPGKQVVVTTRHVNQIETLTADANKRLRQALESKADDEHEQLADEREECRRIE